MTAVAAPSELCDGIYNHTYYVGDDRCCVCGARSNLPEIAVTGESPRDRQIREAITRLESGDNDRHVADVPDLEFTDRHGDMLEMHVLGDGGDEIASAVARDEDAGLAIFLTRDALTDLRNWCDRVLREDTR